MLNYPIQNILFLDVETVPQTSYSLLEDNWKKLWDTKQILLETGKMKHLKPFMNAQVFMQNLENYLYQLRCNAWQ